MPIKYARFVTCVVLGRKMKVNNTKKANSNENGPDNNVYKLC